MQKAIPEGVITDSDGRILGRFLLVKGPMDTGARDLLRADRELIRNFLSKVSKKRSDEGMSDEGMSNPKVNLVKLSGIVKQINVQGDGGFCLIDPQMDSRFIAATIHEEGQLARKLATFQAGDYIQVIGFLRAWSKKRDDGSYENRTEVRITSIPNRGTAGAKPKTAPGSEDGLPF